MPQSLESIWSFSKKDFLPRRRLRTIKNRKGEMGTITHTVTRIETDPKLEKGALKLKLPAGFKKTDDFAPTRRMRIPA